MGARCVAAASNFMTLRARWGAKRGWSRPAAGRSSGGPTSWTTPLAADSLVLKGAVAPTVASAAR